MGGNGVAELVPQQFGTFANSVRQQKKGVNAFANVVASAAVWHSLDDIDNALQEEARRFPYALQDSEIATRRAYRGNEHVFGWVFEATTQTISDKPKRLADKPLGWFSGAVAASKGQMRQNLQSQAVALEIRTSQQSTEGCRSLEGVERLQLASERSAFRGERLQLKTELGSQPISSAQSGFATASRHATKKPQVC
jgi:hypothetical protein